MKILKKTDHSLPNQSKVAIVTGAGSGIGKYSSLALLSEGYFVTLAGRRQKPLEAVAKESGLSESQTLILPTDVSKPNSVRNLFTKTQEKFGRLDLLFNNAGISGPSCLLEDISYEDWQTVVNINLTGAFLCTQEAFNLMKNQCPKGGRIINNGSISAHVPRPNTAPYASTKHAMTGLTKSTALDGRKYNIACGQIDIGNAATEMTAKSKNGIPQPNGSIVVEPTMDAQNIAQAVIYMAGLPLDANVQFMTIMATKMPYIGRG